MLAYSLARVSTPEQRRNASIATQLAANAAYAEARGLTIAQEFAEEESGATLDRAGVAELLRKVRAGEAAHIIVYSLDRLTREPADFLPLRKELHGRGVTIHIAREDRTLSRDPLDELPDDIKVIVAKHERAVFRERSMRGVRAKVEGGRPIGCGPAPYGYQWEGARRSRTLTADPRETPIVQLIFAWYVVGDGSGPLSVRAIVEALNERAIPTRADTARRPKTLSGYAQWNAGSIRAILRNPIYGGQGMAFRKRNATIGAKHATARARALWRPFAAPEIVRPELVRLAQAKIADGRAQSQRRTRRSYLLRCRIRCACGYSMTGTTTHGGQRYAYRCISRDRARGRTPCGLPYAPGGAVESRVWAWLREEVLNPERLKAQAERLAQASPAPPSARDLDAQRLADVDRRIAALLDLYLDGRLPKALLDERHAALLSEQAQITARLADAPEEPRAPDGAFLSEAYTFTEIISDGLEEMTPEEQRRVIDLLDVRLIVTHAADRLIARATCRLRRDVVRLFVDASSRSSCSQSDELTFSADLTIAP
jgi:DNA invertase Pin-like site-specific DNA recombinase